MYKHRAYSSSKINDVGTSTTDESLQTGSKKKKMGQPYVKLQKPKIKTDKAEKGSCKTPGKYAVITVPLINQDIGIQVLDYLH